MDAKRKKLHDRVRRLLALAEGSANPHESAAAAAKAQALMSAHAIDEAMLGTDDDEEPVLNQSLGRKSKNISTWRGVLAWTVADVNRCAAYWGKSDDGERRQLRVVGSDRDIATVRYLYSALVRMCEGSAKAALSQGLIAGRSEAYSYRLGWTRAVCLRLMDAAAQAKAKAPGAAIVRLDRLAVRAKEALPTEMGKARLHAKPKPNAFTLGLRAGRRAQLTSAAELHRGAAGALAEGGQ